MSETRSFETQHGKEGGHMPEQREPSPQEHIDRLIEPEHITGEFIQDINDKGEELTGSRLAEMIEERLSGTADDAPTPHYEQLRELMAGADAFSKSEVYDHKDENDRIFHMLVEYMQSTRDKQRDMQLQRRIGLRLTEMRALIPIGTNETEYDEEWQKLIERLFI